MTTNPPSFVCEYGSWWQRERIFFKNGWFLSLFALVPDILKESVNNHGDDAESKDLENALGKLKINDKYSLIMNNVSFDLDGLQTSPMFADGTCVIKLIGHITESII